jgi:hypothetical protein
VGGTAERTGEGWPLASVADDGVGETLEPLWDRPAVNAWNARRAAVLSWLGWCSERGDDGSACPAGAKRLTPPDAETPVRSKMAVGRLIARREVHLREKTLWRMLDETCARAEETPGVSKTGRTGPRSLLKILKSRLPCTHSCRLTFTGNLG